MTEIRLEKSLPSEQERVGQPSVPAEGLERYFAREGVDPLPYAFEGKIAVHPGLGGSGVEKQDFEATLEPLLAEPRTGKTVAYIHVPFCETHCLYCGFYNKAYREDESRIYADALIQELRLWRGRPGQDAGPVHAVYMGGGTPTALQAGDLRRILKEVRAVLPLANDCEITVEGRLSNFGPDKMEACFEGGANRFSLGVQSFDTEIRQAMGRVSDRDTLIRQLQLLQSYDQAAVIVDLIRLPHADDGTLAGGHRHGPVARSTALTATSSTCTEHPARQGRGADLPPGRTSSCSRYVAAGVKAMRKVLPPPVDQPLGADVAGTQLYNLYVKARPLSGVRSRRGGIWTGSSI
ncbi:MAG: radical SAM protein [Bilophila wadsworthia]